MTITFVPGEVNKSAHSISQGNWKNHHVLVYGSGNNLIITGATLLPTNKKPTPSNIDKNLQTIYLDRDPQCIDINSQTGKFIIAVGTKIIVYSPLNEYMKIPKWQQCLEYDVSEYINCVKWACCEDEIVVATKENLYLFHIYNEYGTLKINQRWKSPQSNPVTDIIITSYGSKILTISGEYDRMVKVWQRINYSDDNTLFEVSYLQHPKGSYVSSFHWRVHYHQSEEEEPVEGTHSTRRRITDPSMANIKNIRGYIDYSNQDNSDIIYTFTNDYQLRVWASYEYSGHNHIQCWADLDLSGSFTSICSILIIENLYLQHTLPLLKRILDIPNDDLDLLLVISELGEFKLFAITNISQCPPNNIQFIPVNPNKSYRFTENSFPIDTKKQTAPITLVSIQTEEFITTTLKPILIKDVIFLNNDPHIHHLSFAIHDRIKNTIRYNILDLHKLLDIDNSGISLLNKFQGHTKSIRKVVRSNSLFSKHNILLSISNFSQHNYIWEPIILADNFNIMSVTKRFQLDVSHQESQQPGIYDAVIINDVEPPVGVKRRHVVVSIERDGHISVWDCNGVTKDDQPADLIIREDLSLNQPPRAFILTEWPSEGQFVKKYCILAIFAKDSVQAWSLTLYYNQDDRIINIEFTNQSISNIPQEEEIYQIGTVDAFIQQQTGSLLSMIDSEGILKTYALDFTEDQISFKLTNTLITNIKRASKIHGSTIINKFAVVDETGSILTIWDIMQGVLEYEETFPVENGPVRDLDWTFISGKNSTSTNAILSIGFARFVLLYTQLRYDYTNKIPTFACLKKIDISDYTSHEIGDSIWLDQGYLIIGSGNQFFIDDRWVKLGSSTIDSMIRQLMTGYHEKVAEFNEIYQEDDDDEEEESETVPVEDTVYDISQLVRVLNGPLPIYHPQFLIQALFMSQVNSVKKILVKLFQVLRNGDQISWDLNLDIEQEIHQTQGITVTDEPKQRGILQRRMSSLFSIDVFNKFNDELADLLTEKLMKISLPLLTRHQQSTLISMIAIVKELNKHLLTLDDNGIRFMIGFKLFQLSTKQRKLSMRDINWALHSDNKELLLNSIEDYYKHQLKWESIKQTGLVYWVKTDRFIQVFESAARNEFSESRDPSGRVSLFYLALRKKQILIGLWRTVNHPEQAKMLKFLNNDFTQDRWKSAALKNAFVLLGKHRYLDAAYFFLLGDACDDCCSTITNKLDDIPLAIAIAKVYHGSSENNMCLNKVIENYILPKTVINGDRWTTSWIFWQLNHKELSIQALIKSPIAMVLDNRDKFTSGRGIQEHEFIVSTKGQSFLRDDPVLILLFNDLRQKKINYLQGSLNITKQEEFQFIIKVCMIYTRMGCDYLALILLRNWTFNEPTEQTFKWNNLNNIHESVHGSSGGNVPNLLESFASGDTTEKQSKHPKHKTPPPLQAFEEPDMSAFSFGF
ncbi:Regulator of V-ATPase in vacuolar membrane protein 1 [Spathaspora sp. JA1]|nr:Regulator of V-ATPase in vacuolar membrane protein 1 [Spathaspora sp. JA1]